MDIQKTGVGFTRVVPALEKQSCGFLWPWGLLWLWDGQPCLPGAHEVSERLCCRNKEDSTLGRQLRLRLTTGFMHMHKHTCSPVHAPLTYLHTCTLQTHAHPTSLHLYSCTSTHTDTLKLQSNPHPHLSVRPHSLAPVNSAAVSGDVQVSLPQSSRWSPRGYSPHS